MSQPMSPITIAAPGFMGLNTQDSSVGLESSWASIADNCVLDKNGRIAARKGWSKVNATNTDLGSAAITGLGEYFKNDGTSTIISIGNKRVFTGTSTLTSIYNDATWTGTNWKMVSFNNKAYFFQRGHDPLYYDGTTIAKLSAHAGYTGTVPLAHEALAAYGRLWVADTSTNKQTVTWSDTLAGHLWTAGASGTLNLHNVFTKGTDSIVALAAFNNFLIIFCSRTIIIYQGASNPATMSLWDVINDVGCVGRDTVQDTGSDILFLSKSGVQSIGRIIQEKSAPLFDISKNVRDDLLSELSGETSDNLKSVYFHQEAFYLITLPVLDKCYVFDTRQKLQDGALRVTTWSGQTPTALLATSDKKLYFGKAGYIGQYSGYLDDTATYLMEYKTNNMNAGDPTVMKILKRLGLVVIGGGNALVRVTWLTDYSYTVAGANNLPTIAGAAEYNIDEYGIAEYTNGVAATRIKQTLSGSGSVFQIDVTARVNDEPISIQQLDVFFKIGRKV